MSIDEATRKVTAFYSYDELITSILEDGYVPTIRVTGQRGRNRVAAKMLLARLSRDMLPSWQPAGGRRRRRRP